MAQTSASSATLAHAADRYGGVIVDPAGLPDDVDAFVASLTASLAAWEAAGVRGVWLQIPIEQAQLVGAAAKVGGFEYHHATPHHLQLTRWLPQGEPSPLPRYAPRADRPQRHHAPELATSRATLCAEHVHMHTACTSLYTGS